MSGFWVANNRNPYWWTLAGKEIHQKNIEVRMDRELEEPDVSEIQEGNELPEYNHIISLPRALLLASCTHTLLVTLSAATTTIPLTVPLSSATCHGGSKPWINRLTTLKSNCQRVMHWEYLSYVASLWKARPSLLFTPRFCPNRTVLNTNQPHQFSIPGLSLSSHPFVYPQGYMPKQCSDSNISF